MKLQVGVDACQWNRPGILIYVFFFFSNRLGCLGSLMLSILITVVLLLLFNVL